MRLLAWFWSFVTYSFCGFLLERGYCFVTVEQLMARRGIEPEDGAVYRQFPPAG